VAAVTSLSVALGANAPRWFSGPDGRPRARRYLLAAAFGATALWSAVAGVLMFAPRNYTAESSFILPNSDPDARVQLNEVGQAYATARNTYDAKSLDPRVNYKEILLSPLLVERAAAIAKVDGKHFSAPRIKLVDQSSIIEVRIAADTPALALQHAEALGTAFRQRLDELRHDELRQREEAIEASIRHSREKLAVAQNALLSFKTEIGVVSGQQLESVAQMVTPLRQRAIELGQARARNEAAVASFSAQLRVPPRLAGWTLTLQGDAVFMEHLRQFATASALLAEQAHKWDAGHPKVREARGQSEATMQAMVVRARRVLEVPLEATDLQRMAMVLQDRSRDMLLRQLVQAQADADSARAELAEISSKRGEIERELPRLARESARLEELQRRVDFSAAVHTGAAGKPDVNHSNVFASYPMVQTLVAPTLPRRPSSPKPAYLIAGGAAASLCLWVGLVLGWLRHKR
jgi:uncharacterized protein involved in exopolysaccharide biosynthesis